MGAFYASSLLSSNKKAILVCENVIVIFVCELIFECDFACKEVNSWFRLLTAITGHTLPDSTDSPPWAGRTDVLK